MSVFHKVVNCSTEVFIQYFKQNFNRETYLHGGTYIHIYDELTGWVRYFFSSFYVCSRVVYIIYASRLFLFCLIKTSIVGPLPDRGS